MPHKHKRKHVSNPADDRDAFDLPPEKRARPLSVHKPRPETWEGFDNESKIQAETKATTVNASEKPNKRRKPNRGKGEDGKAVKDDTPKNFARLMAWHGEGRKLRKGLDDGNRKKTKNNKTPSKGKEGKDPGKRKERDIVDAMADSISNTTPAAAAAATETEEEKNELATIPPTPLEPPQTQPQPQPPHEKLKIKPGERLSDFSLRVDQHLPLSNLPKHTTKDTVLGVKQKLTKHNRHLQRMQTEWRNAENKIKSRKEEENDELADKREEEGLLWIDVHAAGATRKGKKMKARKSGDADDADPWKQLEMKRKVDGDRGDRGAVGGLRASDMVQAPPTLKPVKNMFREPGERRVMEMGAALKV